MMIYIAALLWLWNEKWFWIGACVGIPLIIAFFIRDDDLDGSIRRPTNECDEGTNDAV